MLLSSRCFLEEKGILGQVLKWEGPFGMHDAIHCVRREGPEFKKKKKIGDLRNSSFQISKTK